MCTLAQLKAMNGELDAARALYRARPGHAARPRPGRECRVDRPRPGARRTAWRRPGAGRARGARRLRIPREDGRDLLPLDDGGAAVAHRARPGPRRRGAGTVEDRRGGDRARTTSNRRRCGDRSARRSSPAPATWRWPKNWRGPRSRWCAGPRRRRCRPMPWRNSRRCCGSPARPTRRAKSSARRSSSTPPRATPCRRARSQAWASELDAT